MYTRLQQLFLLLGALGWGASLVFVLLPWDLARDLLEHFGLQKLPYDPMLIYWLRMAGGAFAMLGVLFAAPLIRPQTYSVIIPLLGLLSVFEGIVLLVSGICLDLALLPFAADSFFCLSVGSGLLFSYPRAKREMIQSAG